MSVASLPMYDCFVPYESSTEIWNAIKGDKSDYPESLDLFSSCYTVWTSGSSLIFTQACGYPLVREYSGHLQVIGAPIYSAPGCSGSTYRSALIVSSDSNFHSLDQLLSSRESLVLGVNSFGSFSGWLALLSALSDSYSHLRSQDTASLSSLSHTVLTGSHIGSIKAVQNGVADLACIDGVSLELARIHCPLLLEGIRIIGWGLPAPALPYATNIDASPELVAALRRGLVNMVQSTEKNVVLARQKHLLVGVDVSGDVNYSTYETSVNQHIAIVKATPETAALFDALLPGRPPRESYTVQGPERPLRVDLQCKLEDATWPTADFAMLQGLRRYLARYLWDTLHAACASIHGKSDIAVKTRSSRIDQELTVDVLLAALVPIVGQQLWPVLPDGGKPKLIFCSLRGTLLLLRAMAPTKVQHRTARPVVFNSMVDDILSHPTWTKIAAVARAALVHVDEASAQLGQPRATPDVEADPYRAGFCGAGAASLTEYFPEPSTDGSETAPAAEKKDATAETISKLWAADINLSHHLVRASAKGTNGMIAYISAPRHNDRGDWANLVLTEDEAAIERWRDSRGHSSVRKHVAPWSYDHIRLHRGILQGGLAGEQLVLKRTVFLGPVDKPRTAEPPKADDSHLPAMDQFETELSTLRIEQAPAVPEGGGCPAGSTKGLDRTVVYWADLAPHKGGAGTTTAEAATQGSKVVPGGVHVTLSEFKAQLLNDGSAPFVTVDESLTTPV